MKICEHSEFEATVGVVKINDQNRLMAEIRITCIQCESAMRFVGLPVGLAFDEPTVNATGTEARLPIESIEPQLTRTDNGHLDSS